MAVLAFALVLLAPTLVPSPAHAHGLSYSYCDGALNWDDWHWPSNGADHGAVTICGHPFDGQWKGRAWDNGYGGNCVEIWASATIAGAYGKVPGTTACGIGVVATSTWRSTVAAKMLMVVRSASTGAWQYSEQFYRCDLHLPYTCP